MKRNPNLILLSFLCIIIQISTASAVVWTENLIMNPGAESGSLDGWFTDDTSVVGTSQIRKETSGYVKPYSGNWFFDMTKRSAAPSGQVAKRILYQDIDVTDMAYEIDSGCIIARAGVHLQTEDVPRFPGSDYANLTIYFFDENDVELDQLSTGWVQSPNLTWVQHTLDSSLPVGTRKIRFELAGEKHETTFINAFFDNASLQLSNICYNVMIDIKPGSCPNPVNMSSKGVISVAILGTETFDVNQIDPVTIRLEGIPSQRSSYEDVAAPVIDANECDCAITKPDGYTDLVLKFNTQQIIDYLQLNFGDLAKGDIFVLTITATLFDGTPIQGVDCAVLVGKAPK